MSASSLELVAPDPQSWRRFLWLWAAEMLAITGTGLTAFALGAWIYVRTGSATSFAMLSVSAILPGILLLPLGGVLADLLPRRRVMWTCNFIAGLCCATLALLVWRDALHLTAIYLLLALGALSRALQWVTFTATMSQMVPARHIGRMSAMIYVGEAGQHLLAPAVAALALPWLQYAGVIGLDLSAVVFALLVVTAIPVPSAPPDDAVASLSAAVLQGWRFIRERPGLLFLQLFFAISQFLGGFLPILTLPALVELTGSPRITGITMAFAGAGLISGMASLLWRPVLERRIRATIASDALASAMLLGLGLGAYRIGAAWVGVMGFLFLFFHARESGVSQDLWQRKVPLHLQGRVFAIRRTLSWSLVPACYALAGPLVDDLLTPMMQAGAPLQRALGGLFGTGKLGAILVLMGAAGALRLFVLAPAALLTRPLMRLEEELPDCL